MNIKHLRIFMVISSLLLAGCDGLRVYGLKSMNETIEQDGHYLVVGDYKITVFKQSISNKSIVKIVTSDDNMPNNFSVKINEQTVRFTDSLIVDADDTKTFFSKKQQLNIGDTLKFLHYDDNGQKETVLLITGDIKRILRYD